MTQDNTIPDPASRRVRVLSEQVARKIAAGEVIDRPYAAVRELLDNAVDSGADEITLTLDGGGIDSVRVTDNGCGMTREDLEVCWLPHATSKISALEDLEEVRTLGFRGEALSSMAACSRLELVSSRGTDAMRLSVHGGKMLELGPWQGAPGTSVTVKDLFFNMPARRRFLKSTRAENTLCRRIFLEKAAAHPEISFRLVVDGILKSYLPAGSPLERITSAWPKLAPPSSWWETRAEGDGFKLITVHPRPEVSRKDRQYIQVYANRRRIDEFSLVQAVQYAYDTWMPGGAFPVAFVFIDVDPSLVDFNIHPAKKEARFRDLPAIRHRLIESIKDRLTGESYRERAADNAETSDRQNLLLSEQGTGRPTLTASEAYSSFRSSAGASAGSPVTKKDADTFGETVTRARLERFSPRPMERGNDFNYLGQVMGVFLVAESSGSLFIVDQHAAHERILFEQFKGAESSSERLLIPRTLEPDKAASMRLELRKEKLETLGLEIERDEDGKWLLTGLPASARGLEDVVVDFLEAGAGDAEGIEKALWADLACKAAVKDNSVLDDESAKGLLKEAFNLETPRCPHGRPIWFEVSRTELFDLVGRTV